MPFDSSGNFSRLYSWTQDRDAGIKILSARMDAEFDNYASAMNQMFFRNGLVPMTNNLNMGQNYLIGLGAGSVSSPSIRFADDNTSGLFLNGFNRPSLAVANTTRLEANTSGVAITGALTQNGQAVWNAGNFTPGNYAQLSGATFTGAVQVPNLALRGTGDTFASWGNPSGLYVIGVSTGIDALRARNGNTNQDVWTATSSTFTTPGGIEANGAIRQSGQQVYHSGNFNPGNYALLSGANFTGAVNAYNTIRVNTPSRGGASLESPGDTVNPGLLGIYSPSGTRVGFVGYALGNRLALLAENGFVGYAVSGDLIRNGQGAYANQSQSGLSATMSRGTAAPSGGADGDMYFQYA